MKWKMKSLKSKKGDKKLQLKSKKKSSKLKTIMKGPAYAEYRVCFQAVCGGQEPTNGGIRHLDGREEHIRLLQQDSITTIKPSREDVAQRLENAPYVDAHQLAIEEIARNRQKRRRLREEGRQDSTW